MTDGSPGLAAASHRDGIAGDAQRARPAQINRVQQFPPSTGREAGPGSERTEVEATSDEEGGTGATGGSRAKALTFEDLSQHFHLPINTAAKELGICVTVLKKKCRKFGVARWPHRKLKSLDRLVEKLEREEATAIDKEYYRNELDGLRQKKDHMLRTEAHNADGTNEADGAHGGHVKSNFDARAPDGMGPRGEGSGTPQMTAYPGVGMQGYMARMYPEEAVVAGGAPAMYPQPMYFVPQGSQPMIRQGQFYQAPQVGFQNGKLQGSAFHPMVHSMQMPVAMPMPYGAFQGPGQANGLPGAQGAFGNESQNEAAHFDRSAGLQRYWGQDGAVIMQPAPLPYSGGEEDMFRQGGGSQGGVQPNAAQDPSKRTSEAKRNQEAEDTRAEDAHVQEVPDGPDMGSQKAGPSHRTMGRGPHSARDPPSSEGKGARGEAEGVPHNAMGRWERGTSVDTVNFSAKRPRSDKQVRLDGTAKEAPAAKRSGRDKLVSLASATWEMVDNASSDQKRDASPTDPPSPTGGSGTGSGSGEDAGQGSSDGASDDSVFRMLNVTIWTTDLSLRVLSCGGDTAIPGFHGSQFAPGSAIPDTVGSNEEGQALCEPYFQARKGQETERIYTTDNGKRYVQFFKPLRAKDEIVGTTGLCLDITSSHLYM